MRTLHRAALALAAACCAQAALAAPITRPVLDPGSCRQMAYPQEARRLLQEGEVMVVFSVGEDGSTQKIELVESSGYPILDRATLTSFERCRFKPAMRDGTPVEGRTRLAVVWKLYPPDGIERSRYERLDRLANEGDTAAQYELAVLFARVPGTRFRSDAARWLQKAAEQGHPKAQEGMGDAGLSGMFGARNAAEATEWYRKAALQGNVAAQAKLGKMLFAGNGLKKEVEEAGEWLRKAAEQGSADAQTTLAAHLLVGAGPNTNIDDALAWLNKAVAQGDAVAHYLLGRCYETGRGVARDPAKAQALYKLSATQGYARAKQALGEPVPAEPKADAGR